MEIRFYPVAANESFVIHTRIHATELLALHYDKEELFKKAFIERILKETLTEAEKLKERKMQNDS